MFAWGEDAQKQLGSGGSAPRSSPLPAAVCEDVLQAAVVQVASGDGHSVACDALGGVYSWGRNREGQCGELGTARVSQPMLVEGLQHEAIVAVACGSDSSFAVSAGGSVFRWGATHRPSSGLADANVAGYGRPPSL